MYEISVESHFDAAHYLRGYQGKCEALHGHRYRVVVKLRTSELSDIGLAYDFTLLKKHLSEVISRFDHTCLNDISPFDEINPSSENIARIIYEEIKPKLATASVSLVLVEVWESPESGASFSPD